MKTTLESLTAGNQALTKAFQVYDWTEKQKWSDVTIFDFERPIHDRHLTGANVFSGDPTKVLVVANPGYTKIFSGEIRKKELVLSALIRLAPEELGDDWYIWLIDARGVERLHFNPPETA